MTTEKRVEKNAELFEHRKNTLEELIIYLNKSIDDLHKYTVETIVEGFWMQKQKEALAEQQDFELNGE